jgi:hypothetical protein
MRLACAASRARWLALTATALTALPACGASVGALQQVVFGGQCADGDAACARKRPVAPLAVDARFYPELDSELPGSTTPNLRLESADPDVLVIDHGALLARTPGASAVLVSTDDGAVLDFVHVWVAPLTAITVARRDGERVTAPIALTVGEDVTLVPALWNGAQRLAGSADVTWTVDNAAPLAVLRDGSTERRRLRARAPGHTTVTVALGAAKTTLDVEVVP